MTNDERDIRVAKALPADATGFDPQNNNPTPDNNQITQQTIWHWLLEWFLNNGLPPGWRVYCGVSCPNYSGDLELAREAADRLEILYSFSHTAPEICDLIIQGQVN